MFIGTGVERQLENRHCRDDFSFVESLVWISLPKQNHEQHLADTTIEKANGPMYLGKTLVY